jgi:hypothetical protein
MDGSSDGPEEEDSTLLTVQPRNNRLLVLRDQRVWALRLRDLGGISVGSMKFGHAGWLNRLPSSHTYLKEGGWNPLSIRRGISP